MRNLFKKMSNLSFLAMTSLLCFVSLLWALPVMAVELPSTITSEASYDYSAPYTLAAFSTTEKVTDDSVPASVPAWARRTKEAPSLTADATTQLMVTKGRSQLIKFSQSLVRVSIADPQLADVVPLAPNQLIVNGRQRGVTTLIVWDEFGQEGIFDLVISNDTTELRKAIEKLSSDENVDVRITDDSFVLSGDVSSSVILDEIRRLAGAYGYRDENFINLTETTEPQVVLAVKIVQMDKSVARDIKTSFAGSGNDFTVTRLANAIDSNIASTLGRTSGGLVPGLNALGKTAANGINRRAIFSQSGSSPGGMTGSWSLFQSFDLAFDFLEETGKAMILAEPKLISSHGREASFLAGGEFPYIAGITQTGGPIIEFKEYGVSLSFTPWVSVRSGNIELKIKPEVSQLDLTQCITTTAGQVCGITKRSTETTVQLMDGESMMISGILTRDEQENFAKVPFMSDLPIIGQLFQNSTKARSDKELVVLVTPKIVSKEKVLKTSVR